jgi:signal transduction histidine kinase
MRLDLPVDFPRLASALELGLFRALQESLTNVHRYSGASEVDICVAADAEEVLLTVQDNGPPRRSYVNFEITDQESELDSLACVNA